MGENDANRELRPPLKSAVLKLWRDGQREFTLRLEGRSMDPVALPGHRVTINPLSPGDLCCGDILALQQGETVVVHRFLMARTAGDGRRWYCQMGDNSPAWSWVLPDTVLGRVAAIDGPERSLHLSRRPWTWVNPLAGRLGKWRVLLAGGGRRDGNGFRDANPRKPGHMAHRLKRSLMAPLIRLILRHH